jgi:hypothetical protein
MIYLILAFCALMAAQVFAAAWAAHHKPARGPRPTDDV